MTNFLTPAEWAAAVQMWRNGCDTLQIANRLHVREALVYRFLPIYRARWATVELRYSA